MYRSITEKYRENPRPARDSELRRRSDARPEMSLLSSIPPAHHILAIMFAHSLQRSIRCARASPVISSACRRRFSATPLSCAPENSKNEADDSFDLFDGLRSDHASSSATSKLPGNAKEIEDEDDDAFASPESFGVPGRRCVKQQYVVVLRNNADCRSNPATSVKENPFSMLSDADRTDET